MRFLGRRLRTGGLRELVLLTALTLGLGVGTVLWPMSVPLDAMVVPLVLGSVFLGPRLLPWFVVFLLAVFALGVARQPALERLSITAIAVIYLVGLIVMLVSFRRSRLGVGGAQGESMLVDLRDRIQRQGELPDLPDGWYAESALRSAGGTKFSGDFTVVSTATSAGGGSRLDVAVVDVSGKGAEAGTRALLLLGAFAGLLSAVEPARFLPEANEYLLRQGWEEGFATAVHLSLSFDTGEFELRSAGHPPAGHLESGSGRWLKLLAEGPLLGVIEQPRYEVVTGRMRPGDVLLLYTDGLIETGGRDIDRGIDRLLGHAVRLQQGGFTHGADRLVDQLGAERDDRALVLVHRR